MAQWMSAGTKAKKSPWVTIALRRDQLDIPEKYDPVGRHLRDILNTAGAIVYDN